MSIFISVCFYLHFINTFTSVWVIVFISIFILSNLPLRFRFQLITIGWMRAEYRYNKNSPRNVGVLQRAQKQAKVVACVTGGICVGVLYCFGGGAEPREGWVYKSIWSPVSLAANYSKYPRIVAGGTSNWLVYLYTHLYTHPLGTTILKTAI